MFKPSRRFDVLRQIEQLDPATEHQRIVYLVGSYENPWLIRRALEFALFRTYAVPHTSRILAASGQFDSHGQKRYDDTALLIAGIGQYGYESTFGRRAIQHMNRLHGAWPIENADMIYVLSEFVLEPIRWSERYGWRQPTEGEKLAQVRFWQEVGRRMGIDAIPATLADFEAYNRAHEARYFAYDPATRQIADATIAVFLGWFPAPLRPIVREGVIAMMDDPLREAFGYPKAHGVVRWAADRGLWLLGRIKRMLPPRRTPYSFVEKPSRTYPQGFTAEDIQRAGPGEQARHAAARGIEEA